MDSLISPKRTNHRPAYFAIRYFLGFMLALVVVFAIGMTVLVRSDFRRTTAQVQRQLSHISEVFAQSVESSLTVANVKMWVLIDRIGAAPLKGAVAVPEFSESLEATVRDIPQIDSLLVIDPDGTVLATTSASTPFVTLDVDLAYAEAAKHSYPRYLE